jgi:hypothetical protein
MFGKAELERELQWLEPDSDVQIEFADRPILLASRIVGGDSNRVLAISVDQGRSSDIADPASSRRAPEVEKSVGTSGVASPAETRAALTDAAALGRADQTSVGRQVDLDRVKVTRVGTAHGFWIDAGNNNDVFVLPAQHAAGAATPAVGKTVALDGIILEMPRSVRDETRAEDRGNEHIYIYATQVQ